MGGDGYSLKLVEVWASWLSSDTTVITKMILMGKNVDGIIVLLHQCWTENVLTLRSFCIFVLNSMFSCLITWLVLLAE